MKKKLLAVLLVMSMVLPMSACGSKETEQNAQGENGSEELTDLSTVSTRDINTDEYVTLGEYTGLDVTVNTYGFSDAELESQMQAEFESYVDYVDAYDYTPLQKDTVENGDIVNLDYSGKKDGEAFDGGTAEGAHLEIGSGSFIPGFEDGLIGHTVGDAFDLPLTFPEDYTNNTDLAGQEVVFEIKINSIDERKVPEMTDELVVAMGMLSGTQYQTIDDFREDIREYLQSTCDEQNNSEKTAAIWTAVYEKCEVKDAPQELVEDVRARIESNAQAYADYYGMSMDDFIQQSMGMTREEYEQQALESAQKTAKEKLVVAALAKQAGIILSDEDVNEYAQKEYQEYGYTSVEEMYADIGSGPYYDYVLTEKVNEYLAGVVNVTENQAESIIELYNQ